MKVNQPLEGGRVFSETSVDFHMTTVPHYINWDIEPCSPAAVKRYYGRICRLRNVG
jgi:hypothetical protein